MKNFHTTDNKFPHQRQNISTTKQKSKENISNGGMDIFAKQRGKYSFLEKKNLKGNICCTYANFYHTS